MNRIEMILLAVALLFGVNAQMNFYTPGNWAVYSEVIFSLALIALAVFYMTKDKKGYYTVILGLMALQPLGTIIGLSGYETEEHFTSNNLIIVGFLSQILFAVVMVVRKIIHKETDFPMILFCALLPLVFIYRAYMLFSGTGEDQDLTYASIAILGLVGGIFFIGSAERPEGRFEFDIINVIFLINFVTLVGLIG